jgi:phosphatidylglycerol:prolipoprotein diacylglycerol transferase
MKASATCAEYPEDYAQTAPEQANPESVISFPGEPSPPASVEKIDASPAKAFNNGRTMTTTAFLPALAYFVDSFDPVIVRIWGPLAIRWYGVAYVCGFVGGYLLWLKAVKDKLVSFSREDVEILITWAVAGVLVGGRLGYMLFYDFAEFIRQPLILFRVDQGGMSFHGGALGVALAVAIVARQKKLSFLEIGDLCAMATPVGLFFGRLANFVNGELWGRISTVRWAVVFPRADYVPGEFTTYYEDALGRGIANPRHPSQLYEALLEGLVLGAVLIYLFWRKNGAVPKKTPGVIGGLFVVLYATFRILCENFREPDASLIFGLTRGTFYSLLMAAAGIGLIAFSLRCGKGKAEENAFTSGKLRFDKGAATWDENAERKARSNEIAAAYGRLIDTMTDKPDLFDYGCGTGQSILPIAAKCRSVTGCDFSEGMLAKFAENAKAAGLVNAKTLCLDLAAQPAPEGTYDLITSSMTLHHISDVQALLAKFARMLKNGGRIALVDLETEDGSFHDANVVPHKGFDKALFAGWMKDAGFSDVKIETLSQFRKSADGRPYPLFIATARKR